jgi:signal peptidase
MKFLKVFALLVVPLVLLASLVFLTEGGTYKVYVIHTGSMRPHIPPGSAVLVHVGHYRVGQVITFTEDGLTVTHRLVSISKSGLTTTKGDANPTVDPWHVPTSQIIGGVVVAPRYVGYGIIYLKNPLGAGSVLLAILLLWQVWSITGDDAAKAKNPAEVAPRPYRRPRARAEWGLDAAELEAAASAPAIDPDRIWVLSLVGPPADENLDAEVHASESSIVMEAIAVISSVEAPAGEVSSTRDSASVTPSTEVPVDENPDIGNGVGENSTAVEPIFVDSVVEDPAVEWVVDSLEVDIPSFLLEKQRRSRDATPLGAGPGGSGRPHPTDLEAHPVSPGVLSENAVQRQNGFSLIGVTSSVSGTLLQRPVIGATSAIVPSGFEIDGQRPDQLPKTSAAANSEAAREARIQWKYSLRPGPAPKVGPAASSEAAREARIQWKYSLK